MPLKQLKLELFYLRKALFEHKHFFRYIKNKYFLANKILKQDKVFEKPINNENLSVHILTGHSHLIMALWSLATFYTVINEVGELYIHNDGSLTERDREILQKFFPNVKIIDSEEFLDKYSLEFDNYPVIKKFRTEFPKYFLLKKLIDPYFVSDKKHHLIIDSDLLWFSEPKEIENEIKNNCQNSLMMSDNKQDPIFRVYFKDGSKLSDELAIFNSGIVLYNRNNFSLERLSDYLEKIDPDSKYNQHFVEQAGFAICLENLKGLPQEKYTIKDKLSDQIAVKHYTSPRRVLFYTEGVQYIKE